MSRFFQLLQNLAVLPAISTRVITQQAMNQWQKYSLFYVNSVSNFHWNGKSRTVSHGLNRNSHGIPKQTEPSVVFLKAFSTQHCVLPDAICLGLVCGSAGSLDRCPVLIAALHKWLIHHILVFFGSHFQKCHLSLGDTCKCYWKLSCGYWTF